MADKSPTEMSKSRFQVILDKCNNFYRSESSASRCAVFCIDDEKVGLIRPEFVVELKKYTDVFLYEEGKGFKREILRVLPDLNTPETRSKQIEHVLQDLRKRNIFCTLRGWRDENYDIKKNYHDKPLMIMERAATPIFGCLNYGVHVNGYFYNESGDMMMWLGQRSPTKATYPNKLDNLCAGGLATGIGIKDNMVKECQEEASISDDILHKLKSVGTVSYCYEDERGILPECQFVYDLELTPDFQPINADGEVGGFHCYPIKKVEELMITDEFKPNCALIILDFLIRHGLVTPENEPFYTSLVEGIHKPLSQYL
ncbi:hypothetical protein LOTGIDRAFT_169894 [Lottia gigantea]|uniref:Nudix hydrolase domain-containing protein n=1 Tax=Lottia gigantea TaxID=225164 RepID=V4B2H3_LOTGI|nr:hypothetical protein LOTGIDRAFT_169894 [Lottia gigantea]ESO82574.1 hypothetical protein LOTGIDRAFT_169894 [Lottia gigantea]